MKSRTTLLIALLGAAVVASIAIFTPGCTCGPVMEPTAKVETITYHGWTNALRMRSTQAEVIVVPEIGRVMSFRFLHGENVFWEDRSLDGQRGNPGGKEWINFGGDKTWPAPESDWGQRTGRKEWMPPAAFDSWPVEARVNRSMVTLTSPVDPHYGIRTVRQISLDGRNLSITTTYEKISGEPFKVGVWTITQFKEPVAVYVPVRTNSIFADGHFKFSDDAWPQLQRKNGVIEITRDPKAPHKMGSDANVLLWVGEKESCRVSSSSMSGSEYPDHGAHAEVYTNPDPKKYVELELLGPLSLMKPGDRISFHVSYLLDRRSGRNLETYLSTRLR